VFYIVDATRVGSSAPMGMLSGDAVAQNNTVPTNVSSINSSFVFIVAGSSGSGGITRIGRFTANGATVTNVLEDTNDNGKFIKTDTTTAASLSLDAANPGRGTFTFTDPNFPNAPSTFVFYLNSSTQALFRNKPRTTMAQSTSPMALSRPKRADHSPAAISREPTQSIGAA